MAGVERKVEGHNESQELLNLEGYVRAKQRLRPSTYQWAVFGILVLLTNALTWFLSIYSMRSRAGQSCTERPTSAFFEQIDSSKHSQSLRPWKMEASAYTAHPSKEVDQAWLDLGINYEFVLIPEEYATELALTPDHVYLPAGGNLTQGGYAANMDSLHQLHCVNVLRKAVFYNHDYYAQLAHATDSNDPSAQEFHDAPEVIRGHVNHCIDMLRELLTCHAGTGITPYYWMDTHGRTIPDFARPKQCGNFESLRRWAGERQTFLDESYHIKTPPNVRIFSELQE